jgi:hypothetical protein
MQDTTFKEVIWQQFGAAIDMLENALLACPDELWSDRSRQPEFWYVVYHTLFYLDLYLSGSVEGFTPPRPSRLRSSIRRDCFPNGRMRRAIFTPISSMAARSAGQQSKL